MAILYNRGQYFNNEKTKTFLHDKRVNFSFSALGASKSTGMVEVGNRIVQKVLRRSTSELDKWDEKLASLTQHINSCVIQYLQVVPLATFFGIQATLGGLHAELAFISTRSIDVWIEEVTNPIIHFTAVQKYRDYCLQMYDRMRQLIIEKKRGIL